MLVDRPPTQAELHAHEAARLASLPPPTSRVAPESPAESARRSRQRQAEGHRAEYAAALQAYEEQRAALDDTLGRVWAATQDYHNLVGAPLPTFAQQKFLSIHVPSMRVSNQLDSGFTTTQAHTMAYQATLGRSW